ncbi:MAG: hypothetical protein U1A22_12390 [Xanthomonadaceae bacterium]|nr:hypothetical protein [Xanthomonadaceae bacterium]
MSKLLAVMKRLGKDVDLETACKQDREGMTRQVGCNHKGVASLLNVDCARIGQLTGLKNGQFATRLSTKANHH